MNITASPEAVDALRRAIQQVRTEDAPDTVRVYVAHQCGCGNTKFQMGLDAPEEGDNQIDLGGVTLLVDPMSAEALTDARLDVVQSENLLAPQFSITTASNGGGGGCGCGGHGHQHAH
jgi:Fe-S cluster assembly iron-binding protein IscA